MALLAHAQNLAYILAIISLVGIALRYLYLICFGSINSVPGPLYTRFTNLIYKYYSVKGLRVKYIHSLHQKYGPVVRVAPDEVSISDLPAVKEIHKVSTHFLKSKWYWDTTGRFKHNLFTTPDPHFHRTRRSLLAQPMSETGLKPMEPTVNANIQKAIDGIALEDSQTGSADVFKWFTYMATDIIGELTFAESFRMLDHVIPNQYFRDLQSLSMLGAYRTETGNLAYLLGALQIKPFAQALSILKRITSYAEQSLTRYEKHVEENPDDPKPSLFTKLIKGEADGKLEHEDLVREGISYIVAGSDTTAVTTTYAVYNICKHPSVRAKLVSELATLPANFGWEDVKNLTYLNNIIQETLRLNGAAPASLKRDVPATGATLAGYTIPTGNIVSTQAYTLHRNPATFEDPETFNPDRWTNPTPEMNHAFMAFGGGTRICIGMHLARHEMQMALARFFLRFPNARALETADAMEQESYFLVSPKGHRCLVDLGVEKTEKV